MVPYQGDFEKLSSEQDREEDCEAGLILKHLQEGRVRFMSHKKICEHRILSPAFLGARVIAASLKRFFNLSPARESFDSVLVLETLLTESERGHMRRHALSSFQSLNTARKPELSLELPVPIAAVQGQ